MQTSEHTTAGLSGMKPENPLSISPLEPRNTKLMVARAFKEPRLSKEVTDSASKLKIYQCLQYVLEPKQT